MRFIRLFPSELQSDVASHKPLFFILLFYKYLELLLFIVLIMKKNCAPMLLLVRSLYIM